MLKKITANSALLPPEGGKNGKNHCPERRGWSGLCGSVMRLYRYRSADLFSAGVPVRLPESPAARKPVFFRQP